MAAITLISGKRFECPPATSILDAAANAGITLPYSCKTGRCSSCKCKVVGGSTVCISSETGLTKAEQAEGWVLSCVRSATTDLLLEAEDLGGLIIPKAQTLPCRINSIEKVSPDIVQVFLRLPPTAEFNFIAGQYIDVIGPNGIRRSYSLANCNPENKQLELHIKAVDSGAMSDYWFNQAKPNDLLRLNGPLGTFFLREVAGLDLVFLATGTGIAPIKSIVEGMVQLEEHKKPRSTTVLWGNRHEQDFYMDFTKTPGDYRYIPVISRATEQWKGARGHIQNILLEHMPNLKNAAVYACGSEAMIQSAKAALNAAGLPKNQFHSDAFVCSASL